MLSDEERKAIKRLEKFGDSISCSDYPPEAYIEMKEDIEDILYLIEKQSKEIEELKAENKEIREWKYVMDNPIDLKKLSELDLIKIFGKSYIAVDKIKAKIEEYERLSNNITIQPQIYPYIIEVLQSLLEKED